MKTSAPDKPRAASTVSVKLDPSDRNRIASLAVVKKRTPHYLMREAILEYIQREESRQNFIQAAEASYAHYKETGLHVTFDEFCTWVEDVQRDPGKPIPVCHT